MTTKYNLTEIIDILTSIIGNWEEEFIKKYEESEITAKQMYYIGEIDKLLNPTLTQVRHIKM